MPRASHERTVWLARNLLPHEAALRGWLSRNRGAGLEPDDIVQETYAIIAGLASVDHIRNPRNYMFQTARSVMLRHVRHVRVVSMEAVADIDRLGAVGSVPDPEQHVAARQQLRHVGKILERLPDRASEAFLLKRAEGLSQREIAARMGISENTVEKHVAKALRLLMAALAGGGTDLPDVSSRQTKADAASVSNRMGEKRGAEGDGG